jgi:glycosidase
MAFIENHDTDRFLRNGQDVAALKQALALLLTIKRIPQLYYGTEILMNGTKQVTDGNVRKDFPGGFPGDPRNAFTAEGRTPEQNDMFNWLSALLHWRQGNNVIIKGKMTQFIPKDGIYVVARTLGNKHAVTIINGTTQQREMKLDRYSEVFGNATVARDVPTGKTVNLNNGILMLPPRGTLVLDF